MERYEAGMLAWSRAGHDHGKLYVICRVDEEYVYLTDGSLKPLQNPKKKKIKHIQVLRTIPEELAEIVNGTVNDEEIRKIIRRFTNV